MIGALRTRKNGSVAKAFRILDVLAANSREMTAKDVAQMVGSNLPTTHRFLVSLEAVGAVARTQQGKFQLGIKLSRLGSKVDDSKLLIEAVQPHLDALALECREVVYCAVRQGTGAITIAQAAPERSLLAGHPVGHILPIHCSAAGKMLLASLDSDRIERFLSALELTPHTKATITDRVALSEALVAIRKQGYAVDNQEYEEGVRSVALPIRNARGRAIAVIGLSAPALRLDDSLLEQARKSIATRTERIAHDLFTASRVFPTKARPRGTFPHLKRVNDFIFISGTSARRPDDTFEGVRSNPNGGVTIDIRKQTRAVFENIKDMLAGVGAGLEELVDVQAYLINMEDYSGFNEVYSEFFDFDGPTRTTVAVKELPHPHQALMVRAIAYSPHSHFEDPTD
ncbi:MAG: helix-turn-helix domain-containing protein [Proteobacteria bacterium]|nr:helix-turn-helix domain-containing protein [Pseudomonadota bacterium]